MRSIFVIFALLAFAVASFAQSPSFDPSQAAQHAKADLAAGKFFMLTYGHPHDLEGERVIDSVSNLFGFTYQSIAGCIVDDDITDYADNYNAVVDAYLKEKHGKDWRKLYDLIYSRAHVESLLRSHTAQEIADNYIIVTGSLYFDKDKSQLSKQHLKFLHANAIGFKEVLKLEKRIGSQIVFTVTPYALSDEDKEISEKRAALIKKELLRLGVPAERVKVEGVQPNPHSHKGYGYFVDLSSN